MNEHGFIRSIHKKVPSSIYIWKINDNYAGGVADAYYSGNGGDLWIEYKYLKALPAKDTTLVRFGLSAQQKLWLSNRYKEGRKIVVVVGSPDGTVLLDLPEDWNRDMPKQEFISRAFDKQKIVSYITENTTRK